LFAHAQRPLTIVTILSIGWVYRAELMLFAVA
jgi:hypothetical protein